MISRRGILGAFLAAPVIIRTPGLLMPVKPARALGDGVALQSVAHPIDPAILAVQRELETTFRQWQRARMTPGQAVESMALMDRMGQLERQIATATGGQGIPFAAPADWDPSWWSKQVKQANAIPVRPYLRDPYAWSA